MRWSWYRLKWRLSILWAKYIHRPVCETHGRWSKDDCEDGFCNGCLQDHIEGTNEMFD